MRRALITLPVAFMLFMSAVPAAHAANLPLLDPHFSIVPTECRACPCNYGGVLQLIQNLINAAVSISVIAFVIVAVYAGATIMLNPTNPETRSTARSMFINVFVGLFIVLAAWVGVDFIMKRLYKGDNGSTDFGPWNKILSAQQNGSWCIEATAQGVIPGLLGGLATNILGGNGGGAYNGTVTGDSVTGAGPVHGGGQSGGRCAIQTGGPCTVANLTPYFGANAQTFSKICTHESGGRPVASTVDIGTDGNPVSFGLLQINISTHNIGGYDCIHAFNAPYVAHNANGTHVTNPRVYQQCRAAAMDVNTNLTYASNLFHGSGYSPWRADGQCIP